MEIIFHLASLKISEGKLGWNFTRIKSNFALRHERVDLFKQNYWVHIVIIVNRIYGVQIRIELNCGVFNIVCLSTY